MLDTWSEICRTVRLRVRTAISRSVTATKTGLVSSPDRIFGEKLSGHETKDGTSTNREPRQAYKTAEVGHSQPWVMLAYELLNRTGNGFTACV